jgi:triacylglycerol lipase
VSTLVELPADQYSKTAFGDFKPDAVEFRIGNARALMWVSQLAYETGQPQTIEFVRTLWDLQSVTPFVRHDIGIAASFETTGIICERSDAVILAFAGTDPVVWETLATDFNIRPTPDKNTHIGFQTALDAALPEVNQAIAKSRSTGKPLLVTGHSLGAALAALAAQFADAAGASPVSIYVFGMPRVGGERFQVAYNSRLGEKTFRLVHGSDVVARVPMSALGFRHIGRVIQCGARQKFNLSEGLSPVGSDDPAFGADLLRSVFSGVGNILSNGVLQLKGPGPFGPLFRFLPPQIRDHLQDSYYNALAEDPPPAR